MLPSLDSDRLFAADGGLETTMIFDEGIELPCFASFLLLRDEAGVEALRRYYRGFIEIARRHGLGFTLDTPTWRANRDWGEQLGYSAEDLAAVNRWAVQLAEEIRAEEQGPETPIAWVASAATPPSAATPNSTKPTSSTAATQKNWGAYMRS